jgi:hypothetical protein
VPVRRAIISCCFFLVQDSRYHFLFLRLFIANAKNFIMIFFIN